MHFSQLSRNERGPSGPCHHRRRFDRVVQLAYLSPGASTSADVTTYFRVTNPSGKLFVACMIGLGEIGSTGGLVDPGAWGTWNLTPAFYGPNGEIIRLDKVVDSTVADSTANPTSLPNGWEGQTMAPLLLGSVNISPLVLADGANVPFGVFLGVSWEDVSGSFDPEEIAQAFADCNIESEKVINLTI